MTDQDEANGREGEGIEPPEPSRSAVPSDYLGNVGSAILGAILVSTILGAAAAWTTYVYDVVSALLR